MLHDWYAIHMEALNEVDLDMGIQYCRQLKVPGSYPILGTKELNIENYKAMI